MAIWVFTHVAHTYANLIHYYVGLVWDTNMAAVSLFSNYPSDVMRKAAFHNKREPGN